MVQSDTQGYGFIQPQGGGEDVFVQVFAVSVLGLVRSRRGSKFEYEIVEDRGKTSAVKLTSSDPTTESRASAAVTQ